MEIRGAEKFLYRSTCKCKGELRMGRPPTSDAQIIDGARRAILECGPERLTMSAVAAAAGVSRPTLYRWFPTKSDLLAAITEYESASFEQGLRVVVDSQRSPRRKLDSALRYLVTYLDSTAGVGSMSVDIEFAIGSLAASLEPQSETLAALLGDALAEVPAVRVRALSRQQAAEMFLRLAYSHYLMPHPDPEVLLTAMRGFAGLVGGSVTRAAG